MDLDSRRQGKAVVLKTTTRQTIFLPVIGLVDGGAPRDPSDPPSLFQALPETRKPNAQKPRARAAFEDAPRSIRPHVTSTPTTHRPLPARLFPQINSSPRTSWA